MNPLNIYHNRGPLLHLVALAALLLSPFSLSAEEGAADIPVPVTPMNLQPLVREEIETKIADLESLAAPDEAQKAALEHYQSALAQLNAAQTDEEAATRFREVIDTAAETTAQLEAALERLTESLRSPLSLPRDSTLAMLEQQLDQAQADRGVAQAKLSELEARVADQRLVPDKVIEEVASTKLMLAELEVQLRGVKPGEGLDVRKEAQRVFLQASAQALKSRLKRLELERLSHGARTELLDLQLEVAQEKIAQLDRKVLSLQELSNEKRSAEAAQALESAAEVKREALGKHPLIQSAAEQNALLSGRLDTLTRTLEQTTREKERLNDRLQSLEQELAQARQRLEMVGFDEVLGKLLRTQRKGLPKIRALKKQVSDIQNEMAEARLAQFRIEDQRQLLLREGLFPEKALDAAGPINPAQQLALNIESEKLLQVRMELLESLASTYERYEKVLGEKELTQRQMIDKVALYAELLDSNLLWMPSASPVGLAVIPAVTAGVGELFAAGVWRGPVQGVAAGLSRHPFQAAGLVLLALLLLAGRRRMRRRLAEMAPQVGNVRHDSFLLTLEALVITLLLALPWVLFLVTLSWLMKAGPDPFVDALGDGLRPIARYLLLLQVLHFLLVPNGLAEVHFRWSRPTIELLRANLGWLLLLSLPLFTVATISEIFPDPHYRDNLGRVAAMLGILTLGWFVHRVLNPWNGALQTAEGGRSVHALWYPLTLTGLLLLLVLAFEGYYYTTIRLLGLSFFSVYYAVLLLLLFHLGERWLLVAERRLALSRARARRQAVMESRAAKEAAEAAGESLQDLPELEEIELATINEHTRRLLLLATWLLAGVGFYLLWSQLLPAFGYLDELVLWEYSHEVAGKQELVPVSAAGLLLALLVILITVAAGRNLPGLMEISILEPLAVEPGSRYAVTKVSRYLIYTTGALITISMVGVRWGDVQWLVAAMGVGLGFGLQEIFANFISGLMILFERPIRIGDTVTVGEISGTVSRIRIRATTITDFDNKELVVPNKSFVTDPLINWTLSDPVTRVVIDVGIAYGSDTEKAHRIMSDLIRDHPDVLDDPNPTVFFVGFGESSLDFQIRVFVSERIKRMPLKHDLHMALDKALREAGIEIPFPQRDLHLRSIDPDVAFRGAGLGGQDL